MQAPPHRLMHADLGFSRTLDYVRDVPLSGLLPSLKRWLEHDDPECLMHPHGFFVVLLGRTETEEWRLHFWPRGPRSITGMPAFIHTHDRQVDSRILQGRLTNIQYDVAATSTGGRPLYEVGYGGDRYASSTSNYLHHTGTRVQAVVRSCDTMKSGENYHVERFTYHEAVVPEQLATSTLVCMHGHLPGVIGVVGLDGYSDTIGFTRTSYRAHVFASQFLP